MNRETIVLSIMLFLAIITLIYLVINFAYKHRINMNSDNYCIDCYNDFLDEHYDHKEKKCFKCSSRFEYNYKVEKWIKRN